MPNIGRNASANGIGVEAIKAPHKTDDVKMTTEGIEMIIVVVEERAHRGAHAGHEHGCATAKVMNPRKMSE
jgi:hypothetical protein